MARLGADAAELDSVGAAFETLGADHRGRLDRLVRLIHAAPWQGPDAERFRAEFAGGCAADSQRGLELLSRAGAALRAQAGQQRDTSNDRCTAPADAWASAAAQAAAGGLALRTETRTAELGGKLWRVGELGGRRQAELVERLDGAFEVRVAVRDAVGVGAALSAGGAVTSAALATWGPGAGADVGLEGAAVFRFADRRDARRLARRLGVAVDGSLVPFSPLSQVQLVQALLSERDAFQRAEVTLGAEATAGVAAAAAVALGAKASGSLGAKASATLDTTGRTTLRVSADLAGELRPSAVSPAAAESASVEAALTLDAWRSPTRLTLTVANRAAAERLEPWLADALRDALGESGDAEVSVRAELDLTTPAPPAVTNLVGRLLSGQGVDEAALRDVWRHAPVTVLAEQVDDGSGWRRLFDGADLGYVNAGRREQTRVLAAAFVRPPGGRPAPITLPGPESG
ncbi:MAG: hypothetical protein ACKVWR_04550 [Acidimicrobiales bacterium]